MRIIFTISILLVAFPLFSQVRTISGRLTSSEDGSPLPGVNVMIKGTNIGTATDADGLYTIDVPIGSTLVFAFVGMATKEIVVTATNLQPATYRKGRKPDQVKSAPLPESLYKDTTTSKTPGVATMSGKSRVLRNSAVDPASIRVIRRRSNGVVIKGNRETTKRTGYGLQFSTSFALEKITQLPDFQTQFAQGRPVDGMLTWRGGDEQEIFSWGPLVRTLEFDGSSYSFDVHGRLVQAGNGNGQPAKAYDPIKFFRTGFSTVNEIVFMLPTARNGTLSIDVEHRNESGVITNSGYQRLNMSASLKNFKLSKSIDLNTSLAYNHSSGTLLNRGANLTSIVGAVYRTPATFDNGNNLSSRKARTSPDAYLTDGGSIRSHAPGLADNPYGLSNLLPDNEKLDRLLGSINLKHSKGPLTTLVHGNIDHQVSTNKFGTPFGHAGYTTGRLTTRDDEQTFATVGLNPTIDFNEQDVNLKLSASYQGQFTQRKLTRRDGLGFESEQNQTIEEANEIILRSKTKTRFSHEVSLNAVYIHDHWLTLRAGNRQYFSNTISEGSITNFFPSAGVSAELADLTSLEPFEQLKIFSSISRTIREAPLLYSNWSYASTQMSAADYASFYESSELFFAPTLTPETERKFEAGIQTRFSYSRIEVGATYYSNLTSDFIAPAWTSGQYTLSNVADVQNTGGIITAGYSSNWSRFRWGTDLKWSKYKTTVQALYSVQEIIPLSGFSSIQSVLAEGKPLGAIYGTTYQTNANGQRVIGTDGYPIRNNNLTMIGNPIPDWTLAWSAFIQLQHLRVSFIVDFRRGGDVWNGTNAALDYLGRSARSGQQRSTANYVFEGVDVNGNANSVPVAFADPSAAVSENRWVRYGWEGVGQDNIEDASWIRMSELAISYSLRHAFGSQTIKDCRFSLTARNLFLITPYTGVDPASTLFGNGSISGIDMFNMPATRSFTAQITIKI